MSQNSDHIAIDSCGGATHGDRNGAPAAEFPFAHAGVEVAPALAPGNTVVLKPAEFTR